MQVAELRKEQYATASQARRDQDLAAAKRWIHGTWPSDDWQDIVHAIRDAVNAECLLRDEREHQIPLSGKLYDDEPTYDPSTGVKRLPSIKIDPRRLGLRHGGKEPRLEARRRTYELALLRPEPSTFFDLLRAIQEDDGKDTAGRWLCERCVPEQNEKCEAFPDGSGFGGRLPKWMPSPTADLVCRSLPVVETVTPLPPGITGTVTQLPPFVFAPAYETGCPSCGGAEYGRGFRHADGCPKSTKRVKAPT